MNERSDRPMVLPYALMTRTDEKEEAMSENSDMGTDVPNGAPMRTVNVDADETDGGWVATSPDVPGAAGQGETMAAAMLDLVEAVEAIRGSGTVYEARLLVGREAEAHAIGRHALKGKSKLGALGRRDRVAAAVANWALRRASSRYRNLVGALVARGLEDMLEDVALANDPELRASLDQADEDLREGRTVPLSEALRELEPATYGRLANVIVEVAEECRREPATDPLRSLADRMWEGEPPEDVLLAVEEDEADSAIVVRFADQPAPVSPIGDSKEPPRRASTAWAWVCDRFLGGQF